jgi:hypothetical protein
VSTIRTEKRGDYSVVDNNLINDSSLSWAARGMLTYLLSKPTGWCIRNSDLINQSPLGRDGTESILTELKEAGYLHRERVRQQDGTFSWESTAYESPSLNPCYTKPTIHGFTVDGSAVTG